MRVLAAQRDLNRYGVVSAWRLMTWMDEAAALAVTGRIASDRHAWLKSVQGTRTAPIPSGGSRISRRRSSSWLRRQESARTKP
jgi:hypothetical protein